MPIEHGVKVYVTVNILAHNYDLPGVREYLTELKELKPDALHHCGSRNLYVCKGNLSGDRTPYQYTGK